MKKSTRSLLTVGFCLLVVGIITSAILLPNVEAAKDARKKQTRVLTTTAATGPAVEAVLINETDADTPGTDAAEFIELKAAPGASLDGYVLVFFNGNATGDASYLSIDLDGLTADSNGLVLIGNSGVVGADRTFNNDTLQNGTDAVALYLGDATSFPNGTLPTTTGLVDAVVYDTSDADDTALMAILLNPDGAQVQVDENMFAASATQSIRRCSDAARDGRAFTVGVPTPNAPNANCPAGVVDLNGDGKTDFVIVRPVGGGGAAVASGFDSTIRQSRRERLKAKQAQASFGPSAVIPLQWWGLENGTFGVHAVEWGDYFTDEPVPGDFDHDGKDDIAVWRPAGEEEMAYLYSLNSSDYTFRATQIGQLYDNPSIVGDYDGDGNDDPAVFRCPQGAPGTCYFFYLPSSIPNPGFHTIPFGYGQDLDFLPYVGDFNGDGKTDFGLQGESPTNPGNGIFYLATNGTFEVSYIEWGYLNDRLVPGDFDGDGRTDIAVTRLENDALWWYVLEMDGGMQFVQWGQGGDFELTGDYNADGREDFAVYRWNSTDATFWVQPSGGGSHFGISWGQPDDYPVAYFFVQ